MGAKQMTAAAQKIAAGIINPQVAENVRAQQEKQKQIEAQGLAAQGVTSAIGALAAPIPTQIQNAYQQAAEQTAGFAGGLTGAVGEAARASAGQAAETIGRLAPGVPSAVTSASPAAMNVANYTGGTLPATDLAAEAANRMAQATQLGFAGQAAIGQQALQQMGATRQEIAELQAQGLDIRNTRPAEVQKALADLRNEQRTNIALGMDVWTATNKERREQAAFNLQVKDYMRKTGQDAWAVAKQLSDASGWVYKVVNGVPVKTNQRTVAATRAQSQNQAARVANRIRQQEANTAARKKAAQTDKAKGTGGLTPNQVILRENSWIGGMTKQVDNIIGAVKVKNPITGEVTTKPARMPPPKADLVRKIYNVVGRQLAGKIPRWTEPYLKSLIYSYVSTLPNRWWNPNFYKKP
jgi:hypothetical protein